MSEADIPAFVKAVGSLPAEKIVLPSPLPVGEDLHFHNVKEVKSLLRKDGSFFIKSMNCLKTTNTAMLQKFNL